MVSNSMNMWLASTNSLFTVLVSLFWVSCTHASFFSFCIFSSQPFPFPLSRSLQERRDELGVGKWTLHPSTHISHGLLIEYQKVSSDIGGCAPLGNPPLVALVEFWILILANDRRLSSKEDFLKHRFYITRTATVGTRFGRPQSHLQHHHLLVFSI